MRHEPKRKKLYKYEPPHISNTKKYNKWCDREKEKRKRIYESWFGNIIDRFKK